MKYSPNANLYVSSSKDGDVKVWDGVSNRCVNTFFKAHDGNEVCSVAFSRNAKVSKCLVYEHSYEWPGIRISQVICVEIAHNPYGCSLSRLFGLNQNMAILGLKIGWQLDMSRSMKSLMCLPNVRIQGKFCYAVQIFPKCRMFQSQPWSTLGRFTLHVPGINGWNYFPAPIRSARYFGIANSCHLSPPPLQYVLSSGKDSLVKLWELSTSRCLIAYTGAGTTGKQQHRTQAVFNHTEDYGTLAPPTGAAFLWWLLPNHSLRLISSALPWWEDNQSLLLGFAQCWATATALSWWVLLSQSQGTCTSLRGSKKIIWNAGSLKVMKNHYFPLTVMEKALFCRNSLHVKKKKKKKTTDSKSLIIPTLICR